MYFFIYLKDGNPFQLYTNGLLQMTTIVIGFPNFKDFKLNGLTLNHGDENLSESRLVLCDSGNFILEGRNKSSKEWTILWKINERETNNC